MTDIVNTARCMGSIKRAAKGIKKALLKGDKFSDAEELKHSWSATRMLDELIY